ncbi:protein TAPT1 homolog [Artemia franciscana]|uniref:protein TAPT1 homolog n=1 Tax=Artemia franciscana TaxID=6661 RepID=UPI0032DADE3B
MSFWRFWKAELFRGYVMEREEERFNRRREKVYNFMNIPKQVEKFMCFGVFLCADSFLYLFTYLPLRLLSVILSLLSRPFSICFRNQRRKRSLLDVHEKVDILKGLLIILVSWLLLKIDTAVVYHLIRTQSIIKLYIFYNMLEVADRLCSVFGQDIVDALFWTATEPRGRKREHLGVIPHFILAFVYIVFHTMLILCQATTLSVAMNSRNKALLTIMLSNNFVELKGSVFKKFEKNNLFQLSCADIRERFHLFILLSMVVIQTMREYAWKEDRFWILFPDCITVLLAELIIDWVKHAFITRFNDIPIDVYKDFTTSLAYDLADTKQKFAHTDHSDIVARRMGFTPIPLSVLVIRIILQATRWTEVSDLIVSFFLWLAFFSVKVLSSVLFLGSACELIDDHQKAKGFNKSKQETEILIDEVERDALIGLKLRSKSVCSLPAEATCDVIPRSPKGRSLSQSPVRRRKVTIYDERAVSVDGNGDDLPGHLDKDTSSKPMFYNSTVDLGSVQLHSSITANCTDTSDLSSNSDEISMPSFTAEIRAQTIDHSH